MLFNSLHYYVFFLIVVPVFFLLNEKNQRKFLLWSSLYFYASLKIIFVPLLFLSFIGTYIGSIKIHESITPGKKKLWLYFVLLVNLGILIFFKYTDFLRSIFFDAANLLGSGSGSFTAIGFILPLGLSFYTFQALAYAIDVYRKELEPEKDFWEFSLFLLFFPQLVAGPIMRASVLIPQFVGKKVFIMENFSKGMGIIVLGIFKKTMIADPISNYIEPIYQNPGHYDAITNLLAVFFFAIQIYCDFAGYSDIAIGTGKILGFNIPMNFNRPFLAQSSTELWRRWHISLSTWLRDYVYFSLGGSRVSKLRNYFNVFITMVIGGVWHGAAWTFVIWGTICATTLTIEKFFIDKGWGKFFQPLPASLKAFYSFGLFMVGALFFRSNTLDDAWVMLLKIFTFDSSGTFYLEFILFVPTGILFIIELLEEVKLLDTLKSHPVYIAVRIPLIVSILLVAGMIYTVTTSPQFYYFQF